MTWCAVPGFESSRDSDRAARRAVVGRRSSSGLGPRISGTESWRYRRALPRASHPSISTAPNRPRDPGAIGERFSRMQSLDLVAASRRFYETHADAFDQLVFWTDSPVIEDAFAFETTVQNAITGIGSGGLSTPRRYSAAPARCRASSTWTASPSTATPLGQTVRRDEPARHSRARDRASLAGAPHVSQRRPRPSRISSSGASSLTGASSWIPTAR